MEEESEFGRVCVCVSVCERGGKRIGKRFSDSIRLVGVKGRRGGRTEKTNGRLPPSLPPPSFAYPNTGEGSKRK